PSLAGSYLAWLGVCIFSWPGLWPLVFPPLLLLLGNWGSSLTPFLSASIKVGFVALGAAALLVRVLVSFLRFGAMATLLAAAVLNGLFIVVIIGLASRKAELEISVAAAQLSPACFQRSPLFESLANHGNSFFPHAVV